MERTNARSERAADALVLVEALQRHFVRAMEDVQDSKFEPVEWLRDDGRHGGGVRFVAGPGAFDRASVNVSQVHYDDLPDKRLASATALSCIIHPKAARAPSIHMHISWTSMRDGAGYWRIMADLNPAIPEEADRAAFEATLREAAGEQYDAASAQGDRYFYIPALERHRGVSHFYLEGFDSGDFAADRAFAERIGRATIDRYAAILREAIGREADDEDRAQQLAYHTLYLFQVLTLDRGTTSGLLVHDQNDVGILGSLPSRVDGALLASWKPRMTPPQDDLLEAIVGVLGSSVKRVDAEQKAALAKVVRAHYRRHPEAIAMQASGDVVPPTVSNHR